MARYRVLTEHFRTIFVFRLSLIISLLVCLVVCATAQDKKLSLAATQESTATGLVEAVVTEVQGTRLKLAGGIGIDISKAIIFSIGGERLNVTIKPGMLIRANIVGSDDASSTLVADSVRVQPEDQVVLAGLLQAADLDNGFVTILNRRILITSETSLPVGFKHRKLKADLPVSIVVKQSGADLVATRIFPNIVLPRIFP